MKLSVIITTLIYASSAAAYETRIIPRHESNSDPNPEPELEDGQLGLGRHPWTDPTVRAMQQMLAMERDVAPVAHITQITFRGFVVPRPSISCRQTPCWITAMNHLPR
jgi:hypothetical protein